MVLANRIIESLFVMMLMHFPSHEVHTGQTARTRKNTSAFPTAQARRFEESITTNRCIPSSSWLHTPLVCISVYQQSPSFPIIFGGYGTADLYIIPIISIGQKGYQTIHKFSVSLHGCSFTAFPYISRSRGSNTL